MCSNSEEPKTDTVVSSQQQTTSYNKQQTTSYNYVIKDQDSDSESDGDGICVQALEQMETNSTSQVNQSRSSEDHPPSSAPTQSVDPSDSDSG